MSEKNGGPSASPKAPLKANAVEVTKQNEQEK